MKPTSKKSRAADRLPVMIEPLEPRIAPAALLDAPVFRTATAGGSLLLKAGQVLTTGSGNSGSYLAYVSAGQIIVHTTDLNGNGQVDFNEITGISFGAGARFILFTDVHGDVVGDLNPDGTLTDGGAGDVLLDTNLASITLRSISTSDFTGTATQAPADLVNAHLAMSSYSIFGNIYAGGGLGLANDSTSGLLIDTSGGSLQSTKFDGSGGDLYTATTPSIGGIFVGTAASGHAFNFGSSGSFTQFTINSTVSNPDIHGNLLAFVPASGEAGASIYNVRAAAAAEPFNIGTIQAGNGGFNGAGGNIVNVALQGATAGVYKLIAGNGGQGTTGPAGGSITNFSEAGTVISEVVLQSGAGGTGLTGTGGSAGNITFNPASPVKINAHFVLQEGNGGDGYTGAGSGGGIGTQVFDTPEGKVTTAIDLVSTTRTIGSIGKTQSFDFNNDGFSDAVFSTTNPNQVVVAFGNYDSTSQTFGLNDGVLKTQAPTTQYIFLNAPSNVQSIVVADFNGDGHPDIAIASADPNFAGVEVFLSQYNPRNGAFTGFSDPLYTPLPSLFTPNGASLISTIPYGADQIVSMAAGDFSGTGVMGLAVDVTQPSGTPSIIFLQGETDATHPSGTGWFWSDFANGAAPVDVGGQSALHFGLANTLIATALTKFTPGTPLTLSANHDVVLGVPSAGSNFISIGSDSFNSSLPTVSGNSISLGSVDTNRQGGLIALTPAQALSFTVTQDTANNNIADIVAVTRTPADFLVLLQGGGGGGFTVASGTGDQAGFFFGNSVTNSDPVAIVSTPTNSGVYSNIALLDYHQAAGAADQIENFVIAPNNAGGDVAPNLLFATITPGAGKGTQVAFDTYIPHPVANVNIPGSGPNSFGFITGNPLQSFPDAQDLGVTQPTGSPIVGFTTAAFKTAGYYFTAGNGGNAVSGAGGNGGSFGSTLTVTGTGLSQVGTGSLSIVFPNDPSFEGVGLITAGNGGNGFNNAGNGGHISGISVTYSNNPATLSGFTNLSAGNGGQSLTGAGGSGGSLAQMFITAGEVFTGGDGGIGTIGGSGGSIIGNSQANLITSQTNNLNPTIEAFGGNGAIGITGGGNGGSVTSFVNQFNPFTDNEPGFLIYQGGNAGDAVLGNGGTGGSVVNSSPSPLEDFLSGDILVIGGNGGNGLRGGSGGSVTNFNPTSTIKNVPSSFAVLAGYGGNGTNNGGGSGGNVSNVFIAAQGTTVNFQNQVNFNRVIAGAGGNSFGGAGGAGGSLSTINTASTAASGVNVSAAGAGGFGLTAGGAGGTDTSVVMDAGGSGAGKILIVAGDGGDVYSVKAANTTPQAVAIAIGTNNGAGGNGGAITNFTQPSNVNGHVDLIAGNGGATINHSTFAGNATTDNSGVGGSLTNIHVAGSIGASDPTAISTTPGVPQEAEIAIASYNDVLHGQTMQQFIDTLTVNPISGVTINNGPVVTSITDATGNVGLVAGAAGRVENANSGSALIPSGNGINGSVTTVRAENIQDMVAGNVEQVDLIQRLTDYSVTINGGVYGSDKAVSVLPTNSQHIDNTSLGPPAYNQLDYLNAAGDLVVNPLPGGGALIDGAILAKNIRTLQSIRDFEGTQP